jgi:hypothetical protein
VDPKRRVARVRELVLTAVGEPAMNALVAIAPVFARVPTPLLGALSGMVSNVDVQASNIPGFPEAPYFAGAKITKMIPFGPVPGVAMMVVMVSWDGMCQVGVVHDTDAVSDPELFARCLREGFDEVLALGDDETTDSSPSDGPRRRRSMVETIATGEGA